MRAPISIHGKSPRAQADRPGVTIVEFAVIAPVVMLLVLGLIVGGLGISRYQAVAHLAREATRYASTHGGAYQSGNIPSLTDVPAVSSQSDIQAYLANRTVGLDPANLTVTISWSAPNTVSPINSPVYIDTNPNLVPPAQIQYQNYVSVTVSYRWMPENFLTGPITLTSTSKIAMSY